MIDLAIYININININPYSSHFLIVCSIQIASRMLYHSFETLLLMSLFNGKIRYIIVLRRYY